MQTDVLLEQLPDNRYRATGLGTFALTVEGASRSEALANFQKAALALLPQNAEVVTVDIPAPQSVSPNAHPWAWIAGTAQNDPLWERYLEQIEINRRLDEENEARKLAEETAHP